MDINVSELHEPPKKRRCVIPQNVAHESLSLSPLRRSHRCQKNSREKFCTEGTVSSPIKKYLQNSNINQFSICTTINIDGNKDKNVENYEKDNISGVASDSTLGTGQDDGEKVQEKLLTVELSNVEPLKEFTVHSEYDPAVQTTEKHFEIDMQSFESNDAISNAAVSFANPAVCHQPSDDRKVYYQADNSSDLAVDSEIVEVSETINIDDAPLDRPDAYDGACNNKTPLAFSGDSASPEDLRFSVDISECTEVRSVEQSLSHDQYRNNSNQNNYDMLQKTLCVTQSVSDIVLKDSENDVQCSEALNTPKLPKDSCCQSVCPSTTEEAARSVGAACNLQQNSKQLQLSLRESRTVINQSDEQRKSLNPIDEGSLPHKIRRKILNRDFPISFEIKSTVVDHTLAETKVKLNIVSTTNKIDASETENTSKTNTPCDARTVLEQFRSEKLILEAAIAEHRNEEAPAPEIMSTTPFKFVPGSLEAGGTYCKIVLIADETFDGLQNCWTDDTNIPDLLLCPELTVGQLESILADYCQKHVPKQGNVLAIAMLRFYENLSFRTLQVCKKKKRNHKPLQEILVSSPAGTKLIRQFKVSKENIVRSSGGKIDLVFTPLLPLNINIIQRELITEHNSQHQHVINARNIKNRVYLRSYSYMKQCMATTRKLINSNLCYSSLLKWNVFSWKYKVLPVGAFSPKALPVTPNGKDVKQGNLADIANRMCQLVSQHQCSARGSFFNKSKRTDSNKPENEIATEKEHYYSSVVILADQKMCQISKQWSETFPVNLLFEVIGNKLLPAVIENLQLKYQKDILFVYCFSIRNFLSIKPFNECKNHVKLNYPAFKNGLESDQFLLEMENEMKLLKCSLLKSCSNSSVVFATLYPVSFSQILGILCSRHQSLTGHNCMSYFNEESLKLMDDKFYKLVAKINTLIMNVNFKNASTPFNVCGFLNEYSDSKRSDLIDGLYMSKTATEILFENIATNLKNIRSNSIESCDDECSSEHTQLQSTDSRQSTESLASKQLLDSIAGATLNESHSKCIRKEAEHASKRSDKNSLKVHDRLSQADHLEKRKPRASAMKECADITDTNLQAKSNDLREVLRNRIKLQSAVCDPSLRKRRSSRMGAFSNTLHNRSTIFRSRSPLLLDRRYSAIGRRRSPAMRRSRSPAIERSRLPAMRRSRSPAMKRSRFPVMRRSRSPVMRRSQSPAMKRSRSPVMRRSRSPAMKRSRSPVMRRSRSPAMKRSRSPVMRRSQSPAMRRIRSPTVRGSQSPAMRRSQSPSMRRIRSPAMRRIRSPAVRGSRSPALRRGRSSELTPGWSPVMTHNRSPEMVRCPSPEMMRGRSPEMVRSRSPEMMRGRSSDLVRGRSPEMMRGRSSDLVRGRSTEIMRGLSSDLVRGRSPEMMRGRSPEMMRGRSPEMMRGRSPEMMRGRSPEMMRPRSPAIHDPLHGPSAATNIRYKKNSRHHEVRKSPNISHSPQDVRISEHKDRTSTAMENLWQIHEKECNIYRSNPELHPDHAKERSYFLQKRSSDYLEKGIDPFMHDFSSEFKSYWSTRMESLLTGSWEEKKNKCLQLLKRKIEKEINYAEIFHPQNSTLSNDQFKLQEIDSTVSSSNIRISESDKRSINHKFTDHSSNKELMRKVNSELKLTRDLLDNTSERKVIEKRHTIPPIFPKSSSYDEEYLQTKAKLVSQHVSTTMNATATVITNANVVNRASNNAKSTDPQDVVETLRILSQMRDQFEKLAIPIAIILNSAITAHKNNEDVLKIFSRQEENVLKLCLERMTNLRATKLSIIQKAIIAEAYNRVENLLSLIQESQDPLFGLDLKNLSKITNYMEPSQAIAKIKQLVIENGSPFVKDVQILNMYMAMKIAR